MDNLFQKLMLSGSTAALIAVVSVGGAKAQASGDIEQVVVSASRVTIAGYTQPTPVTVVGAAQLESEANINIGDSIRQLPALGTSESLDNGSKAGDAAQGDAGVDSVALRNLGVTRTLVLFDGQRVVTSNPLGGGVDLSTIPTALIQRVDVVTGGASASWGSDAVGGVVNLILNKNFDGIKLNEEIGQNYSNQHQQYRSDGSFGTDVLGGRGHIVISGSYTSSPDAMYNTTNKFYNPITLFPSATLYPGVKGLPTYVHTTGALGSAQYTSGGLIASGPLAGVQFVGQNATPTPFSFGTTFAGNCVNCTANNLTNTQFIGNTAVPYHSTTLFGFARYKISDTLQASLQLNYGTNSEKNSDSDKTVVDTISVAGPNANPFVPATITARAVALGQTTIPVSTNNLGNIDPHYPSSTVFENSVAMGINYSNRQLLRGVFTLDGQLGDDWSWDAYVQHSQVREVQKDPQDALTSNYNNAVNAVVVSAANVGNSGLPIGSIQCATTLTNPTNGCQPLNIFGNGNYSQAAINYIDPGRLNSSLSNTVLYKMYQDVVAGSMQGTLPWELPAGKVAVEFGAEYRHEQQRNQAALPALDGNALWSNGNFSSYAGQYQVAEGNLEVDGPILKNNIVQSLDFSLAGRITSYSTSGMVETWKIGLTSQIDDNFKLRTTWSEDIRAPIISELFAVPQYNRGTVVDPKTGKTVNVLYTAQGNTNLVPEQANTISAGVVFTPTFIDGLSASLDYYSIVIKSAIFTPTNQQVLNGCGTPLGSGNLTAYCSSLLFNNPISTPDYPGALNLVLNIPQNVGQQVTSGFDFQSNYRMDLFNGTMDWSLLANYTDAFTQTLGGVTTEGAGSIGADTNYAGTPQFKGSFGGSYTEGPWNFNAKVRFTGQAVLNKLWTSGVQVDNNELPWVAYLDLGTSYKWNEHIQFYGTIKNTTNTPPPNIPSTAGGSGSNYLIYDNIGRFYQGGIRIDL